MSGLVRNTIPVRITRTSQPQHACDIDWSNPITRGLGLAWNNRVEATPKKSSTAPYGSPQIGKQGVSGKGNGSSTFALLSGNTNAVSAYGTSAGSNGEAITFIVATKIGGLSSQQHFINTGDGNNTAIGFRTNTTSVGLSNVNIGSLLNFTSAVTAGEECVLCLSGRNGSTDFFKNGKFIANDTTTIAGAAFDGTPVIGRSGGSTQYGDHAIYMIAVINRRLSRAEGISITANPWQIFQPIVQQLPYDMVRGPMQRRESYMMGTTPPAVSGSMPATVGKKVWTSQPQVPVGIDRSNKFGELVIDSLVGTQPFTSLGKPVTKYGTLSTGAYQGGYGYKSSGAGGFGFPCNLTAENGITIVFEYTQYSRSGSQVLFEHSVNQNGNAGTFICYTDSATNSLNYGNSSGATYDAGYVTAPTLGQKTTVALRLRFTSALGNADMAIAMNGVLQTTINTNTSNGESSFGNYQTYIFGRAGNTLNVDATFGCYAVLKGFATDSELARLSANPWQIFAPLPKQVWVPA